METDAASGGSDDWVKGVAGVKFAYTVELPDRGDFGFLLPASEILPVGQVRSKNKENCARFSQNVIEIHALESRTDGLIDSPSK